MAAEVAGGLQEEALKRKERLLAMRQKSAAADQQQPEVSLALLTITPYRSRKVFSLDFLLEE